MAAKTKPTVVIDTNLFISAIIRGGTPYKLLEAWKADKFILATTQTLFEEMAEVFARDYIYQKYKLDKAE
ncbi:putative toxin-antitoxin system toxin component, PIN family, partial [Candidatus Gottesmanbacteria bacterium RIFCSPHIGHO2_01_FULL_43_15]